MRNSRLALRPRAYLFGCREAVHRPRTTWLTAGLYFLTLVVLQALRPLPVSLPLLFVSVTRARLGWVEGRLRVHYLWIAAVCAAFAIIPVFALVPSLRPYGLELLIGTGLIVAAIGDDRVLRKATR